MSQITRKFLKSLSDSELLSRTDDLVREERRITIELLHHLREVEARMLYAERGFSSLYAYLTEEHRYSNGSAHRRIEAMRAMKDLPELEEALQEGKLNLTTASQIQVFLKQESTRSSPYTQEAKRELFEMAHGLSVRDTEKLLVSISPESALPRDREREVAPGKTEITFLSDDELMVMLKQIRELTSHVNSNGDYLSLFKGMAKITLEKLDPARKQARTEARRAAQAKTSTAPAPGKVSAIRLGISHRGARSAVPAERYREVWVRDDGQCQYMDSHTGRKCGSRFKPEVEHIIPLAAGGTHELENLEVLCKTHNQFRALQWFGKAKMSRYLPKLSM